MPDSTKVLQDRAAAAVELALGAGADGAWASASASRSTSCQMRDGEVEKMQESISRGLSIELYVDGRYFTHSTSDLRPEFLRGFMAEAVKMTRALQPDEYRKLPDPKLFEGISEVDLEAADPSLAKLHAEDRIARCRAIDGRMTGEKEVVSATTGFDDGEWTQAAASSNGFAGAYGGTWISQSGSVTLRDEGDKRPEEGMWATAHHDADLPDPGGLATRRCGGRERGSGRRRGRR